jgi:hypothetical protein
LNLEAREEGAQSFHTKKCVSRFSEIVRFVAMAIDKKNQSESPMTPLIEGSTLLRAFDPNAIVPVEDTRLLYYKSSPVEIVFQGGIYYVQCGFFVNASDQYLYGLVAHELFRNLDAQNGTLFEGDHYGMSRQLPWFDNVREPLKEQPRYHPELLLAYKKGFSDYRNSCNAVILSPEGPKFDQYLEMTEYQNSETGQFMTVFLNKKSSEAGVESVSENLELSPMTIRESLKNRTRIFDTLTQFSKKRSIRMKHVHAINYASVYNLNNDVWMECENRLD